MIIDAAYGRAAGRQASWSERAVANIQVIWALIERDVQSRFGQNALGYGWTFVAPFAWIGATYFAFYFFGRRAPVYTDTITFIISGLIPYAAFRYVINTIGRVNSSVRGLLIFPSVAPEHAVIAAAIVEFVNIFIVFAVVAAVNLLVFGNGELDDPLMFVEGVGLAWGLGASYGYLLSVLGRISPIIQQAGVIALRPTYLLSGVFFTANELPDFILRIFGWNPVLHAIDIARDGMLFHYQSRVADPAYPLIVIAALLATAITVGMALRD